MCFPALPAVAGIAGSLMSAAGSIMAGNTQAAGSRAQAKAYQAQSENTFYQGEYEAGRVGDKAKQVMGQQIAGYSESGVNLTGSPSDVIASSASSAAMDIGAIRWSARSQAQNLEYQSKLEKINARSQQIGGYLGAAAGVLGGISKFTTLGKPYGAG